MRIRPLRWLSVLVTDTPVRVKMASLGAMVLGVFGLSLATGAYLHEEARIGGARFQELKQDRILLELVALQKADLNEVRADLGTMTEEGRNADEIRATRGSIEALRSAIDERYGALLGMALPDEKRLALEDARATWDEFLATIDESIMPALFEGRHAAARRMVSGVQHRRYRRFDEQVGALVELIHAETVEREEAALEVGRRLTVANVAVNGGAAALALLALWSLTRSLTSRIERLSHFAQRVATGDLTETPPDAGGDEVGRLQGSLRTMVERLRALLATLTNASDELARAAALLGDSAEGQKQLLEQQASFLSEASATMRELEQTSAVASNQAESVLGIAQGAAEYSRSGEDSAAESLANVQEISRHMGRIVERSSALGEQARVIEDIVESVKDIAAQSHVLSLNASLEAARAGEAGRGFAVVANEVRALAHQSGESATRIGKIIKDMASAVTATIEMTEEGNRGVESGIGRIRASGQSLKEIGSFIGTTSEAALQIAGAVKQQGAGVRQMASAISELDARMKDAVRGIREVSEATTRLETTSQSIRGAMSEFRT